MKKNIKTRYFVEYNIYGKVVAVLSMKLNENGWLSKLYGKRSNEFSKD
jgi:hypothetical protein